MRPVLRLILAVILMAAVSCTEDTPRSELDLPESPPPVALDLGEEITFAGVSVSMNDLASFEQNPDGFPRLVAVMRSENVSNRPERNPLVSIVCEESSQRGDWSSGSTWEPDSVLRQGKIREGQVILTFPKKSGGSLYPVLKCTTPQVELSLIDNLGAVQKALIEVPPELIDEAVAARRGPERPLPLDLG